ncbi:MAG TPA: APC family permease [Gemmatimonadales bacterium]|nr:APC family permease [Gemmatimonadales bacterium]
MTSPQAPPPSTIRRVKYALFGKPRDLQDHRLFHRLSLIPFLAWVGLGADGLSSSAYGPEEAFRQLGAHPYLALPLAALMATTVLLISAAYRRIIEEFPSGGGGYVVATKLLGPEAGVVSGSALLVDYVLTITISIAAAGDALFSFMPLAWHGAKLPVEFALLSLLTALNIRGVRESVLTLLPVFLLFLVTHVLIIGVGLLVTLPKAAATLESARVGYGQGVATMGLGGLLLLFIRAYSLGGGTYTGIEAVSNGLPIMREPKAETGKRTMLYMGTSLAFTASGLLLCYLFWQLAPAAGKTMNAVLVERLAGRLPLGAVFVVLFLFSEAMLLVVAAQAGFIDGPRVLANMAVDSWVPHRFAALSERLTTQNGILLMGGAAFAALLYTRGDVGHLVVMYSINVFLTFSLSMYAMLHFWYQHRTLRPFWKRRMVLFAAGFSLCVTILGITIFEKFAEGGWITVLITLLVIGLCFLIRGHYRAAAAKVGELYQELGDLPHVPAGESLAPGPVDRTKPTAAILVHSYGGVGIHTVLNVFRSFPGHFGNLVFLTVGVVDSGEFKGEHAVEELRARTEEMLGKYVALAHRLGVPATSRLAIGTEVVAEAERLCLGVAREFPHTTFFAGKMIFQKERWWQRFLHNETAMAIQKRLQWAGKTVVTLPIRVREASA